MGDKSNKIYWKYAEGLSSNTDLILLNEILTKKGNAQTETEVIYQKYDSWGNPISLNSRSEGDCCYLWSYNGAYPIAYIVGATFDEIKNLLGEGLINKLENSVCPSDEDIQKIRALLFNVDVLVTTYTYLPLLGVVSITAPNGKKEFYEYDSFGRLLQTKDNQNNVMDSYIYHYAN